MRLRTRGAYFLLQHLWPREAMSIMSLPIVVVAFNVVRNADRFGTLNMTFSIVDRRKE